MSDDEKYGVSFFTLPLAAITEEVVTALLDLEAPSFPERWESGPLCALGNHVKEITDTRGEWPDVLVTQMWDWHARNRA